MKILILDNYDSFTYNLVRYVRESCEAQVDIFRNNEISLAEVAVYDKILLSPGPGVPKDAGIMNELVAKYGQCKSILGVCLGCQSIAEVYGGSLRQLSVQFHGVADKMHIIDEKEFLYEGIEEYFEAGRYHSWVVNRDDFPLDLIVTAEDAQHQIMSLRHTIHPIRGVQFHPESMMTPMGRKMIENWLAL